ncbi:MAG: reverse transcriptase-like protein [Tissierellia bacterium]|nr:reverse transcriptase-like protein [Tissierellia bacterium]
MAEYYYAVKVGRKVGIYNTWSECEAQVKGYSGAVYKKFTTHKEALKFIGEEREPVADVNISSLKDREMVAYVDGSFDQDSGYYSYGVIIFTEDGKYEISHKEKDEDMKDMRNVAGEIRGAMVAMEEALKRGKNILYLYYDYMGIEKWASGEWKTNKYGTKMYKEYYDSIRDRLQVVFKKVTAHSGNEYNEKADSLAKKALGKYI